MTIGTEHGFAGKINAAISQMNADKKTASSEILGTYLVSTVCGDCLLVTADVN